MFLKKFGDLAAGVFFLILSIALFLAASALPPSLMGGLGSDFMPKVLAIITCILSFFQIRAGFRTMRSFQPNEGAEEEKPEYLRVLGTNGRGMALLREMKSRAALPILTKPAHISEFSPEARRLFALERRGTDLYGLCFETVRPGGLDYTSGPVILEQGPQSDGPTSLF